MKKNLFILFIAFCLTGCATKKTKCEAYGSNTYPATKNISKAK